MRSKAVQIIADLGAGPVLRADEFAADDAVAVDQVGFRPHVGVVELRCGLRWVAHRDEIDVMTDKETGIGSGIVVDADGEDGQGGHLVVQFEERRQLLEARGALAPPEVEQDDIAAIAGQMHGGGAVGDRKIGRGLVGLRGMRAAVARRDKGDGRQKNPDQDTRKPHISIIRSERAGRKRLRRDGKR